MKPRIDEEKKNNKKKSESRSLSPNNNVANSPQPQLEELTHEQCIWPFYLCLDENFAKTFMCSQCNMIPKQNHSYTSMSGYIFCEYCIDKLIETGNGNKIDQKAIKHKNPAKVIDNLVKSLRIKCPHCKQSQLQQINNNNNGRGIGIGVQSKSHELKMDEIDDEDDIQIQIPPFPTNNNNQQRNPMYNEGVDENQIGIVGIGGGHGGNNKKKDSVYYCDWVGTINDLPCHLQNDCKFIKINCPLYDLDPILCDIQNLYQHQMKHHLEQCSVTHWQHIIKQINELKSMQLSIVLKQQFVNKMDNGELESSSSSLLNNNQCTPTPNPININDLIQSQTKEISKLRAENEEFKQKIEKKIQEITKDSKMKDVIVSHQNSKLNMMQKEIACLRKIIEQQSKKNKEEVTRRKYHDYESDITSMFNHNSYGQQKMLEMQQKLLQTQNKIDSVSTEMKVKDNLIDSQNKSISTLQSQIANMNIAQHQQHQNKHHPQPGQTPQYIPTPGGIQPIYSTHSTPQYTIPPSIEHTHSYSSHHQSPGHTPISPPSSSHHPSIFDSGQSSLSYTASSEPQQHRKRHHQSPLMHHSKSHSIQHTSYSHPSSTRSSRSQHDEHHYHHQHHQHHQQQYLHHSANSLYHHQHPLSRGGDGSKSLNYIQLNESEKIYRSDSGGSIGNRNDNDNDNDNSYHVPSLIYSKTSKQQKQHRHYNNMPRPNRLDNKRRSIDDDKLKMSKNMNKPRLSLYGVGYNEEGEIGLGHRSNLSKFTRLSFCDTMHIIGVYYGSQSFFYLTASNELYCCGYNKYGQLGLGHTTEYIIKPTLNKYFKSDNRMIDFISNSVCSYHTILKTENGKLYGYGWNNNGQLGIGKKSFKESVPIELTADVFNINSKYDYNIICISCGFHHTLFLTDDGRVICCGSNQYGQLGFGNNVNEVISPSFVDDSILKNIISIECGEYYSTCLDKNGFVFVFGRNDSGQLGLGDQIKNEECIYSPRVIEYFKQNGIVITKIQCGDYHTLCLDSKGNVFAFGSNEYSQIGDEDKKYNSFVSTPNLCKLPNNNKSSVIIDIDAGAYHSVLLSEDNQIYTFGNNDCNQCSTLLCHKKINSPYWVKKKSELNVLNENDIIQIIAGYDCSFLITNE